MAMSLRNAATTFLGVPPGAGFLARRNEERKSRRNERQTSRPRAVRVEPELRAEPAPEMPLAPGVDVDRILIAARNKAPELSLIEWDGDRRPKQAIETRLPTSSAPMWQPETPANDPRCRKIRDRYIRARFPGVARCAADLESPERVIKAARLYFEDGQPDLAFELLDCALEQDPQAEPVWLALLETVFLAQDAARYVDCARAFHDAHPASEAWSEVTRLGRSIAPSEPLFGPSAGPRDHDHYGPWPHLPNWIQASWDLTAEVVAADFHRAMAQRCAAPILPPSAA